MVGRRTILHVHNIISDNNCRPPKPPPFPSPYYRVWRTCSRQRTNLKQVGKQIKGQHDITQPCAMTSGVDGLGRKTLIRWKVVPESSSRRLLSRQETMATQCTRALYALYNICWPQDVIIMRKSSMEIIWCKEEHGKFSMRHDIIIFVRVFNFEFILYGMDII